MGFNVPYALRHRAIAVRPKGYMFPWVMPVAVGVPVTVIVLALVGVGLYMLNLAQGV